MEPDLSKDKLRIQTKMNNFIRKGQPVPVHLLQIYSYIKTIEGGNSSSGTVTADNG